MEPTDDREKENVNYSNESQVNLTEGFDVKEITDSVFTNVKKRNSPVSSLSASESEGETDSQQKKRKTDNDKISSSPVIEKETYQLPTLKIKAVLGGKILSFPVHPRLTLIDLKDFILFSLNIPHPQQVLSFYDESADPPKLVILSNFSENTLLCGVPGLIDEVTGRCAPVGLSFKMASGMDFTIHPSDVEYETASVGSGISGSNEYFGLGDTEGFFEISSSSSSDENRGLPLSDKDAKLSALASSLASIIPLPPGVTKSSKMLFRSLSKTSPTNSNLPTLWEIYFPESGIKMMVTALINVSEVKESATTEDVKDKKDSETITVPSVEKKVPALVITPEEPTTTQEEVVSNNSATSEESNTVLQAIEPKNHCEKCRIRCRPALRFVCKCNKTFCQTHRYPDQHACTYDHRAEGLASIQANNPKIVKDKISNF